MSKLVQILLFLKKKYFLRYFLDIAYCGFHYHGWQIQANAKSIQAEIQAKLSLILGDTIEIVGSGRTDTGVHAEQQIAHFDFDKLLSFSTHIFRTNQILNRDIVIKNAYLVDNQAHSRFDAIARTYEYRLSKLRNPFLQNLAYFDGRNFDFALMNEAAQLLKEYEDFECFSKVKTEVNHFNCQISRAEWNQKDDLWVFTITANRFLRGMVRAIVGTLLNVGLHKINLTDFQQIIQSKNRNLAGRSVPPEGLFLTEVKYPYKLIPI